LDHVEESPEERKRRQKREAMARWRAKPANLEKDRRWNRKASAARYATPEGRANHNKASAAWNATPKGKAYSREYQARRMAEDGQYKISQLVRTRIYSALRAALAGRSCRSLELLGCTAGEYRLHLEALFEPGMTWENWGAGGWHVDHVRPLASFDLCDPAQQREAFHFSNTRPAWAEENLSKGSLYEGIRHRHAG